MGHAAARMCPERRASYAQLADAFQEILDRTPVGRRLAYLLVHEDELSIKAVAKQLGVTPDAAESRVRTVRRELRAVLEAYR